MPTVIINAPFSNLDFRFWNLEFRKPLFCYHALAIVIFHFGNPLIDGQYGYFHYFRLTLIQCSFNVALLDIAAESNL